MKILSRFVFCCSQRFMFLFTLSLVVLLSCHSASVFANAPAVKEHPKSVVPKIENPIGFVQATHYVRGLEKERYELILPKNIVDTAIQTSWNSQIKTTLAGISLALAVITGLVFYRRKVTANPIGKSGTVALLFTAISLGTLSSTLADLLPMPPAPTTKTVTVKIVNEANVISLVHYVKQPPRKSRNRPPKKPKR